jgi:hypothetical protein
MRRDVGEIIALIAVGSGALVLVLSYVAAYMVGKSHGRREEQRTEELTRLDADQRLAKVESSLHGLNSTVERLMDAQRLLVAQQDHLSRKVGLSSDRMALPGAQARHTPS